MPTALDSIRIPLKAVPLSTGALFSGVIDASIFTLVADTRDSSATCGLVPMTAV